MKPSLPAVMFEGIADCGTGVAFVDVRLEPPPQPATTSSPARNASAAHRRQFKKASSKFQTDVPKLPAAGSRENGARKAQHARQNDQSDSTPARATSTRIQTLGKGLASDVISLFRGGQFEINVLHQRVLIAAHQRPPINVDRWRAVHAKRHALGVTCIDRLGRLG